ncbi:MULTISPECIES: queuine tRNA-ribosyltransferase [unclassified Legionella]|uniref:queuine tRNA-ribosyltransferase n=1 Tax=unclassified Legionella TaxID=2622702 RepID=UPI001054EB3C|nr:MULTISPECIES: queuine tRNA-ribosyltransferase [unclassified Legionella]MDI9817597.1 queuine tRNA-ribosyltransferase [Legionella sp. PL877]
MIEPGNFPIYIPVLTSEAGSCLTFANWQEAGVSAVSYHLDALLLKPGLLFLESLANLRAYCGWPGTIVLNAMFLSLDKEGFYAIRSPYDGSLVRVARGKILSLIKQLQPDLVLLPPDIENDSVMIQLTRATKQSVLANKDLKPLGMGCYMQQVESTSWEKLREETDDCHTPVYLAGELDLPCFSALADSAVRYMESDVPARNALAGKVYSRGESINLLDREMANQHIKIDDECLCPVCQQQFSRAYLHHLLIQTPLLCQRFLIQHNTSYCLNNRLKLLQA